MDMADSDVTLGEVYRGMDRISHELASWRLETVLRTEFEQYKTATDREIVGLRNELSAAEAKKQPWTSVLGALTPLASLILAIMVLAFVTR